MMVEGDDFDTGPLRNLLEFTEPAWLDGLDHDQPSHLVRVYAPRLDDVEPVSVEAVELAHVSVQRARERDGRAGIKATRREHRREGVEVGIDVRDDDVHPRRAPAKRLVRADAAPAQRAG